MADDKHAVITISCPMCGWSKIVPAKFGSITHHCKED